MTIGEKIKYFRTQRGITQAKLAELADIHPVTIRKYETNLAQPQKAQIDKIAGALDVSYSALVGVENNGLRLETVGDLMGVLMVLFKTQVIYITGERGKDLLLIEDTVEINLNPFLKSSLEMMSTKKDEKSNFSLEKRLIDIRSHGLFQEFLKWERQEFLYQHFLEECKENGDDDETIQYKLKEYIEEKELLELELQKSTVRLEI